LIIAHLTALEIYQRPSEKSWTLRIRRPTDYGTRSFENGPLEPSQATFSSASTVYEQETSRSSTREPVIKRKPVPRATQIPGEYPSQPLVPPSMMSGARRPGYHVTNLSNGNGTQNESVPLEPPVSVSRCPCGHINHVDPKWESSIPTSRQARLDRVAPISRIKKASASISRYLTT
jgi:hypothetical protein